MIQSNPLFTTRHYESLAKLLAWSLKHNRISLAYIYDVCYYLVNDNSRFNDEIFHKAIATHFTSITTISERVMFAKNKIGKEVIGYVNEHI